MFRGSMVAVVTPMRADGELDYEALARLVEFHLENGTDAIVSVGTTGESATLDFEEHIPGGAPNGGIGQGAEFR